MQVLKNKRLVFNPIAAIEIPLSVDSLGVRAMNMTANDSAAIVLLGQMDHVILEVGDVLAGSSTTQFNPRTPMLLWLVSTASATMEGVAEPNQLRIQPASKSSPRQTPLVGLQIENVAVSYK